MARSAILQLVEKNLIGGNDSEGPSIHKISKELARPVYLPRRRDGSFRKYRFPNVRARNISESWRRVYIERNGMHDLLSEAASGEEARSTLVDLLPGIGMKEASHFLRDVKFSDSLAIVDSHVMKFLESYAGLQSNPGRTLTPRRYLHYENTLRRIATQANLSLAILDMALWEAMRQR